MKGTWLRCRTIGRHRGRAAVSNPIVPGFLGFARPRRASGVSNLLWYVLDGFVGMVCDEGGYLDGYLGR